MEGVAAETLIKFNATVVPPCEDTAPEEQCCADPGPTATTQAPIGYLYHSDPLMDALPIILTGIGVAYLVGMLTSAWIFSPTGE